MQPGGRLQSSIRPSPGTAIGILDRDIISTFASNPPRRTNNGSSFGSQEVFPGSSGLPQDASAGSMRPQYASPPSIHAEPYSEGGADNRGSPNVYDTGPCPGRALRVSWSLAHPVLRANLRPDRSADGTYGLGERASPRSPPRSPISPSIPRPAPREGQSQHTIPVSFSESDTSQATSEDSERTVRPEERIFMREMLEAQSQGGTMNSKMALPVTPGAPPVNLQDPSSLPFSYPTPCYDSDEDDDEGGTGTGLWLVKPRDDGAFTRPSAEDVYERLDDFFPQHILDKPVLEAASGGTSPTSVEQPQLPLPTTAPAGFRHKKSIRHVAAQHGQRIKHQSIAADDMRRKRSTKLWGSKLEEVTPAQAFSSLTSLILPESPSTATPKRKSVEHYRSALTAV
jgi:hypothetical protein